MADNNVYIRDLPYEFLKKNGESFADSQKFKSHEELFLSLKKDSSLLPPDTPQAQEEIPKAAMDGLRELIYRKYVEKLELKALEEDRLMTVFFFIQAKAVLDNSTKQQRKRLIPVTGKSGEMEIDRSPTVVRRVLDNPTLRRLRMGYSATPSLPPGRVRPARTGSSVKDIVSSSKFYQSTKNQMVYDDYSYATHVAQAVVREAGVQGTAHHWRVVPAAPNFEAGAYPFLYKDVASDVELIRRLIGDRYVSQSGEVAPPPLPPEALRAALVARVGAAEPKRRAVLLKFETVNLPSGSSSFALPEGLPEGDFVFSVLSYETMTFDLSARLDRLQATRELKLTRAGGGEACVVVVFGIGTVDGLGRLAASGFSVDEFSVDEPKSAVDIDCDGSDDSFLLEAVSNSGERVSPLSVKILGDYKIRVSFRQGFSGKIRVVSCAKNWPSDSTTLIHEDNIDRVLGNVNFFKKVYKKWTQ